MKTSRVSLSVIALGIVGMASCADGPAVEAAAEAGVLVAVEMTEDGPVEDELVLLGADGNPQRTVELGGFVGWPGHVLAHGKYLVTVDDLWTILDTATGETTPVTGAMQQPASNLVADPHWVGVSEAGDWLVVGNAPQSDLGLVNTTTGESVSVSELLETRFIISASLDSDGSHLTVVHDDGVTVVPTDAPDQFERLLPDGDEPVFGIVGADGDTVALTVRDGEDGVGRLFLGSPGGEFEDTGRRAFVARPLASDWLLTLDGEDRVVLVSPDGTDVPLDVHGISQLWEGEGFVILTDRDDVVHHVVVDANATTTTVPELEDVRPVEGPDGLDGVIVTVPVLAGLALDDLVVLDGGEARILEDVGPYDTWGVQPLAGERVVLWSQGDDEQDPSTRVVDLASGEVVEEFAGVAVRAVAPDGSAMVVRPRMPVGGGSIVSLDGSDPIALDDGLEVLAWTTGA